MVVSALTILGLDELSARYSSCAYLASAIRFAGWVEPAVQHAIHSCWKEVCDEARLSKAERSQLWRREILPEYVSWDRA